MVVRTDVFVVEEAVGQGHLPIHVTYYHSHLVLAAYDVRVFTFTVVYIGGYRVAR